MEEVHLERHGQIAYSCYTEKTRQAENVVAMHVFSYVESGSIAIEDVNGKHILSAGDCGFYPKNALLKFTKLPDSENGEYRSLSIRLDENRLKHLSESYPALENQKSDMGITNFGKDKLLQLFAQSLIEYIKAEPNTDADFLELKRNEIATLLLKRKPELANVLFDFSAPGKIPLEDFMRRNYHFNLPHSQFAYLSGRSLASFKRDFQKTFGESPGKWLQHTRLEEAGRLIREKGAKPTEVYLDVGFENLSHFSDAFKKEFGVSPSKYR